MTARKTIKARFLKMIFVALIIVFVIWFMSFLQCENAPPAY